MFRETKPKLKEKAYIGPTDCSSICHLTLATKSEKWLKMKKLSDEWLGAPGTNLMYLTFFKKECHNCPADNLDKCHMSFDILQPVIAQCGNLALLNSLHGLNQPTRPYSWLNELPSILFQKLEKKTQQPPPPRNVDLRFHSKQYFGIIFSEVLREKPETNFPPPPAQIQQRQLTDPFSGS